jgi:superoxide dismutase, Cu-Zn family
MTTKITLSGLSLAALLLAPGCGDDAKTPTTDGPPATVGDGAVIPDGGSAPDGASVSLDLGHDGPGPSNPNPDVPPGSTNLDGGMVVAMSTGAWVVYDPAGPAKGIMGMAAAYDIGGGSTRYYLVVSGLAPMFAYGAHVHKLACADMMAGGHYQNVPPMGDAAANDPAVATAANEVWLDFTTDAMGAATKELFSTFRPRAGEAKSIVVHAMMTGAGGAAGAKLACLNIAF